MRKLIKNPQEAESWQILEVDKKGAVEEGDRKIT